MCNFSSIIKNAMEEGGSAIWPEKNKVSFVSKVYMRDCRTFGKADTKFYLF